jgi:hypothetical protein
MANGIAKHLAVFAALAAAPLLADPSRVARAATYRPIFHGAANDCDGPNFGGHLPKGFVCKGTGTGVATCLKPGDARIISTDVQVNYCHLDWFRSN